MSVREKSYPAPWHGKLVLACRKCQKKLKHDDALQSLAKLKKTAKRYNKKHLGYGLEIIQVPCMDLCPKDGVTVCVPQDDALRLMIVRSEDDLITLAD